MHGFKWLFFGMCLFIAQNKTYALSMNSQQRSERRQPAKLINSFRTRLTIGPQPGNENQLPSKLMEAIRTRDENLVIRLIQKKKSPEDKLNYVNKPTSRIGLRRVQHREGNPLFFAIRQYISSQEVALLKIINLLLEAGADPKIIPAGQSENSLALVCREKSYPIFYLVANYYHRLNKSISDTLGACFPNIILLEKKYVDLFLDVLNCPPLFESSDIWSNYKIQLLKHVGNRLDLLIAIMQMEKVNSNEENQYLHYIFDTFKDDLPSLVQVLETPNLLNDTNRSMFLIKILTDFLNRPDGMIKIFTLLNILKPLERQKFIEAIYTKYENDSDALARFVTDALPRLVQIIKDEDHRTEFLDLFIAKKLINHPYALVRIFKMPNFLTSYESKKFLEIVYGKYKDNNAVISEFIKIDLASLVKMIQNPNLVDEAHRAMFLDKVLTKLINRPHEMIEFCHIPNFLKPIERQKFINAVYAKSKDDQALFRLINDDLRSLVQICQDEALRAEFLDIMLKKNIAHPFVMTRIFKIPDFLKSHEREKFLKAMYNKYKNDKHVVSRFVYQDLASFVQMIQVPNLVDEAHRSMFLDIIFKRIVGHQNEMIEFCQMSNFLKSIERQKFVTAVYTRYKDDTDALFGFVIHALPSLVQKIEDDALRADFLGIMLEKLIDHSYVMINTFKIPNFLKSTERQKFLEAVYNKYKDDKDVLLGFINIDLTSFIRMIQVPDLVDEDHRAMFLDIIFKKLINHPDIIIQLFKITNFLTSIEREKFLEAVYGKYKDNKPVLSKFVNNGLAIIVQMIQKPILMDAFHRAMFLDIIIENFISKPDMMIEIVQMPDFLRPVEREKFLQAICSKYADNIDVLLKFVEVPNLLSSPDRSQILQKVLASSATNMDVIFRIMRLPEITEEEIQPFADSFFVLYENAINTQNIKIVKKYLGRYAPDILPFSPGQPVSKIDRYNLYYRLSQNLGSGCLLKKIINNTNINPEHLKQSFEMFSYLSESHESFETLQTELLKIFDQINFDELEKSGKYYRASLINERMSFADIRQNIINVTMDAPYGNRWSSDLDRKRHKNSIAYILRELPKLLPQFQAQILTIIGRGRSCTYGVMGSLIYAESIIRSQSEIQFQDVRTRILFALTMFRQSFFIEAANADRNENQHVLNFLHHRFGEKFGLPGPHPAQFSYLDHVPSWMQQTSYYDQHIVAKYDSKAIIEHLLSKVNKVNASGAKDAANNVRFGDLVDWCRVQNIPTNHLMFDPDTYLFTEIGLKVILMHPSFRVLSIESKTMK